MQFKTRRLKQEFNSKEVSPYLRACIFELDRYCRHVFEKPMIITCVLRSPDKQIKYCKRGNFKSGFQHCAGEAVDSRTWHLTKDECRAVQGYSKFNLPRMCQLKYHVSGTAPHHHLALIEDFSDKAKIWAMIKNENAQEWFVE